jgi:hypothetical protein
LNTYSYKSIELPAWVLLPVVVGYVTMTRGFAHIGVSPLYVGEATLGLLLYLWPGIILGTWLRSQLRSHPYTNLATLAAIFVAYGFLQCVRGVTESAYPKGALQNFAFHYYVAFLFAGIWIGERHRELLPRLIWCLAWINAIYGSAYLLAFGQPVASENAATNTFLTYAWPAGAAISILGLLCYERGSARSIVPLLMNAFVLVGRQVRAEWLAFAVAITLFCMLRGRLRRLIQVAAVVAGLIVLADVVDLRVPARSTVSGEISARDLVGRALSSIDERAAAQLSDHASAYSGTVSWRTEWWRTLLELTHKTPATVLFGLGYGFPIWEYNQHIEEFNPTPHNIFIFILTYTGWVGVFIFYALQLNLAWMLWKGFRRSGQPFGICLWTLMFVWAHFDNRLETPYGAIPFWVLVGMALASTNTTANVATGPSRPLIGAH